ncbi:HtaA domain-containing protein [Cryptosporangium aurantiacum]|uniref:Htaa protein n=1 Tax=Cryptosporangium aurantiacum TaxID=134849 RepID=A0A1M7P917_9ACTN|nr:HtaA domain-containing protein [Cryptosporangium aurantiacum]SHN12936.1 Htaa protein [Cryptosporangium aurantiacum]
MTEETPPYGLRWAIKRSFVDYVRRMPDGKGFVSAGAFPAGPHDIVFPPEAAGRRTAPDGTAERYWTFHGDVRFSGHFGMLFVQFAEPRIDLRGEQGELSIADGSERLSLATLRIAPVPTDEDVELWAGTEVALTESGAGLFNDVYPVGEQLEDLLITLPVTTE